MAVARPSPRPEPPWRRLYIPIAQKFVAIQTLAWAWVALSVWISIPWLHSLSQAVSWPFAIIIIGGIAYLPGYMNAFQVFSLLFDHQPPIRVIDPDAPLTILIAAYNEQDTIEITLEKLAAQDYSGPLYVVIVDNCSTDATAEIAKNTSSQLGLNAVVVEEPAPGKNHALNTGLRHTVTDLVVTLDADTLLHPSAIRYLVARYLSSPVHTCAVAGAVLVRNSRSNLLARMQEWDYFLGIASTKRYQGMYQSTLVAQGAFSLYRTASVKKAGGWPDAIGEDIVLTWKFFRSGERVNFEPLAVAFTDVPTKLPHFARQRSRWARGMLEGMREVKPWQHPSRFVRFLTGLDLVIPYMDFSYSFFWLPGIVLAFLGKFWIIGPETLLVFPLTLTSNYLLYRYQKRTFQSLNLKIRRNWHGFVLYVLCYQVIMSPISVWGYFQELLRLRRVWQ